MVVISDEEFADFIQNKPLYSKIRAVQYFMPLPNTYSDYLDFDNKPFNFFCPHEKKEQTFRTSVFGAENLKFYGPRRQIEPGAIPDHVDEDTNRLELIVNVLGKCQSCHKNIHFLIRAFSEMPYSFYKNEVDIFIQKVGQFPSFEIKPHPIVKKYLTDEDKDLYNKALINRSHGYGIGAFAYLRRIIENEIIRIIRDISELEFDGVEKIKAAFTSFDKNHQMSSLIEAITNYLPKSLLELGDNPIKLLHDQLSGGIHTFSEDECLAKAEQINILLSFVIKKVNEEKFDMGAVKRAMQNLRSGN